MRKFLISAVSIAVVATAVLAAPVIAGGQHIDRCRGVVQHIHGANVCVPAAKRSGVTVDLGPSSSGFKVAFSFATTMPGAVAQVYGTNGVTLSIYVTRSAVLLGSRDSSVGIGRAVADGRMHRLELALAPDGATTLVLDGKYTSGWANAWYGHMTSTIHITVGGWAKGARGAFLGNTVGTDYHGTVTRLSVAPGA